MKLLLWNVEWATASSRRGKLLTQQMLQADLECICLIEGSSPLFPPGGSIIHSSADYGYDNRGDRRKVLLWSSAPWEDEDDLGSSDLPPGRFISGVTKGIRFVGVCIPWKDAHVRTGYQDRTPWQDHLSYLLALKPVLQSYLKQPHPVCLLGDFNQRWPRVNQPLPIAKALADLLKIGFDLSTSGLRDPEGHLLVDHIAISGGLQVEIESVLSKHSESGVRLTDHAGVIAKIETRRSSAPRSISFY